MEQSAAHNVIVFKELFSQGTAEIGLDHLATLDRTQPEAYTEAIRACKKRNSLYRPLDNVNLAY